MRAMAEPRARTAVKACHSSSKSFTAAELALWWACAMGGMCLTTAPTWQQVSRILWGYIKKFHARARFPLGGTLRSHELRYAPDRFIIGLSTNEGVRFQGYHGSVLVILDEAPGILPEIWEAVDSIRAGGDVRVLALGNPLLASGPFYDAFTTERANWDTFTIDAFDTPNLTGLTVEDLREMSGPDLDYAPRPYLATRRWVKEKLEDWGEESGVWQSRVRGNFPPQAPDALLSLAWLEAAQHRERADGDRDQPLYAGVDVAGPGEDETVLCVRQGGHIRALRTWSLDDVRGAVTAALLPYRERHITVTVDAVGIGYHLATHLVDQGYTVRFFNAQGRARDDEKFRNAKAEEYWGLRERFEAGAVSGLLDERALGQLGGIRYRQTPRGQIEIEPKDQARKRGVSSPDRAEAVMLAFAGLGAGRQQPLAGGQLGMGHGAAGPGAPPPTLPHVPTPAPQHKRTPVGAPLAGGPLTPRRRP
jgi:phage terminase large subunit